MGQDFFDIRYIKNPKMRSMRRMRCPTLRQGSPTEPLCLFRTNCKDYWTSRNSSAVVFGANGIEYIHIDIYDIK